MAGWISLISGWLFTIGLVFAWPHVFANSPIPAERWLLDVMHVQDSLADGESDAGRNHPAPETGERLIFVGGSSTLFGIDGPTWEAITGRQAINLGLHADLSSESMLRRARRVFRPGDHVVLGFELSAYHREAPTDFDQRQSLVWRAAFYEDADPIGEFQNIWQTPLELMLSTGLSKLIRGSHPEDFRTSSEALDNWEASIFDRSERPPAPRVYSALWVDPYGTIYVPLAPTSSAVSLRNEPGRYGAHDGELSGNFYRQISNFTRYVRSRGGRVTMVPPPLMEFEPGQFDARINGAESFDGLLERFNEVGVETPCSTLDAIEPPEAFYNTIYHLNAWGAARRALRLAACMEIAQTELPDIQNNNATWRFVLAARLERGETMPWEAPLYDLLIVAEALEAYHEEHGEYPQSLSWDGVGSRWGRSTENWVEGLAPRFIPVLPRAPTEVGYLYRSDGAEYKLIFHVGDELADVRAIAPEFVDPQRDQIAVSVTSSPTTAQW
ncbi:MAG: hypothetical protein RIA71_10060 [Oceanicaulis sp.]